MCWGGGAKDGLLCRMTADCAGIPVIAGPVEATALGNLLIQLTALGELNDLNEGRRLVAATQNLRWFEPQPEGGWDKAAAIYETLLQKTGR